MQTSQKCQLVVGHWLLINILLRQTQQALDNRDLMLTTVCDAVPPLTQIVNNVLLIAAEALSCWHRWLDASKQLGSQPANPVPDIDLDIHRS